MARVDDGRYLRRIGRPPPEVFAAQVDWLASGRVRVVSIPDLIALPEPDDAVALTFDDGPDERSTPALLDLLKAEQVTAAFFCVGRRVAASPELARRIVNGGHLLENHSFGHSHFTNFFSLSRLKSELEQTQAAIQSATGTTARFFRPPMGLSNPRTFRAVRELGLKVIGWSARGLDTVTPDPEKVIARILRQVRPGTIILLHDGNIPAERLVLTMRLLLARLREREYEIVRLDQMMK